MASELVSDFVAGPREIKDYYLDFRTALRPFPRKSHSSSIAIMYQLSRRKYAWRTLCHGRLTFGFFHRTSRSSLLVKNGKQTSIYSFIFDEKARNDRTQ